MRMEGGWEIILAVGWGDVSEVGVGAPIRLEFLGSPKSSVGLETGKYYAQSCEFVSTTSG